MALTSAREAQAKIRLMRSRSPSVKSTSSSPLSNLPAHEAHIPWLMEGSSYGGCSPKNA